MGEPLTVLVGSVRSLRGSPVLLPPRDEFPGGSRRALGPCIRASRWLLAGTGEYGRLRAWNPQEERRGNTRVGSSAETGAVMGGLARPPKNRYDFTCRRSRASAVRPTLSGFGTRRTSIWLVAHVDCREGRATCRGELEIQPGSRWARLIQRISRDKANWDAPVPSGTLDGGKPH